MCPKLISTEFITDWEKNKSISAFDCGAQRFIFKDQLLLSFALLLNKALLNKTYKIHEFMIKVCFWGERGVDCLFGIFGVFFFNYCCIPLTLWSNAMSPSLPAACIPGACIFSHKTPTMFSSLPNKSQSGFPVFNFTFETSLFSLATVGQIFVILCIKDTTYKQNNVSYSRVDYFKKQRTYLQSLMLLGISRGVNLNIASNN